MKTENMKIKLRILLVMLAVILVAVAGAGCSAKAKKAYHLSRAEHYYAAGQFDSAEIEYLNVLHLDSQNAEAFSRLGLIYYDEGRLQRALIFLAKASQLAPDNLELRLKLGFIESSAGQTTNALAQANFVLDRKPQDGDAPLLLAEAALRPSDAAAARQRLQSLIRAGDRAAFEAALGNLAMHERDVTTAAACFQKALALDPKSPAVNVGLATVAWARDDLKQADAYFQTAANLSPMRSPHRMQYVRFKLETGDPAAADALLVEIVKAAPNYVPAILLRAEIAAAQNKFDAAQDLQNQAQKLDPDNFDGLLFKSRLDLARGNASQAVADLERMAHLYPGTAPVHVQLGKAYLAVNDLNKAATSFSRALELNPNFTEAIVMLAETQIKSGNVEPAIASLEALRRKQPALAPAQLLLADAYRLHNRVNDALEIYAALEKAYPTNEQVVLRQGVALLQTKDSAGARRAFERVLRLQPGNLPALDELVQLDLSEKQFEAAQQLVDQETQRNPKQMALPILSAQILLAQGKYPAAEATLQRGLQADPTNQPISFLLAQTYSLAGQNEKALDQLNAVMARAPSNTSALMIAARIYDASQDHRGAANAYEKVLQIDPKSSSALNNLAYQYEEYLNDLDRAHELAQRARELSPFDPSTADTLGWIDFKRGAYDSARELLRESAAKSDDPEIQFHAGMANYMADDETAARTALQRAWQSGASFPGRAECGLCLSNLAINPATADAAAQARLEKRVAEKAADPVAWSRLGVIYQRAGNHDQAIAAYEAVLRTAPKNLGAMVNLTRLYAAKDTKKAYEMAKAANQLAPYDPEASHNLGRLAFASGDYSLAAGTLQQALQNQPNDAGLLFDYAQAAYSIGRVSDAETALHSALAQNLPAPQAEQARQWLNFIALAAAPAQAATAAGRIDAALKTEPNDVPALMARGVAAMAANQMATAEQAFETALAQYPDFTPAQKELARLYAADPGKLDRAYSLATKVQHALPDDPNAAKVLGIILVQRADYGRAQTPLLQSAAKLTADPEVFYYLGTAQLHSKNRTDGKANLQKALDLKLPAPLAASAKQMLGELK